MRAFFLTVAGVAAIGFSASSQFAGAEDNRPGTISGASDAQPRISTQGRSRLTPVTSATQPAGMKMETAVFAGGCFWCTEFAFEQLAGVVDVESGYCGGTKSTANYNKVHLGTTGHAEAVRVTYDPNKITYEKLLSVFFDSHDPTQLNRQGEDYGRQYRSAIFFASDDQQKQAEAKIADLNSKHVYQRRIVTKLEPLQEFYPAEIDHQNFVRRNPFMPYVQSHALPQAYHVRRTHPELIRNGE